MLSSSLQGHYICMWYIVITVTFAYSNLPPILMTCFLLLNSICMIVTKCRCCTLHQKSFILQLNFPPFYSVFPKPSASSSVGIPELRGQEFDEDVLFRAVFPMSLFICHCLFFICHFSQAVLLHLLV